MQREIGAADLRPLISLAWILGRRQFDAIHSHSSKAGALTRIAAFMTLQIRKSCYSPHGFAFLRSDVPEMKRRLYRLIESGLHKLGGKIAACSATEKLYAEKYLGKSRVHLLENAIDTALIGEVGHPDERTVVRVVTVGRVTYQKAPWRFGKLATDIAPKGVEFVWLGDGSNADRERWLDDSPVSISGWLDKQRLMDELSDSDVFVLASLWEGMPIALIEAQAMGIPAVASNIEGNKDVVVHGETGFLADTDESLLRYTQQLVNDPQLRRRMGRAARRHAIRRFGKDRFVRDSELIYFGA